MMACNVAKERADIPKAVAHLIKVGLVTDIEPYILAGVLIEGLAGILARVPVKKQSEAVQAAMWMLQHRLIAAGIEP